MRVAWRKYKKRWGWLLLLSMLIAAAFGYYAFQYEPDIYQSSVGLYVLPGNGDGNAPYDVSVNNMVAQDFAQLLQSPELLHKAEQKLSPDVLDDIRLTAGAGQGSHLVTISALGTDPALCQRAITAVSVVLLERMESLSDVYHVTIAERAQLPAEPVGPNRALQIACVGGASFALLSCLFLLFVPKRSYLRAEDKPEAVADVSVIGSVTDFRGDLSYFFKKSRKRKYASNLFPYINRAAIEDVKNITLSLRSQDGEEKLRSIVVASDSTDEGRSSITVLLAGELANQGSRVLLVEMDCFAPMLGRFLGIRGYADLVHHLAGEATLDQVVLPTNISHLFFIDNCHTDSFASRMIGSPAFSSFMALMYEEFDFIVFDTPPVNLFADAASFGSVLDGTLLVAANGRRTTQELTSVIEKMKRAKNRVLGVVFSFAKAATEKQYREYEDTGRWR